MTIGRRTAGARARGIVLGMKLTVAAFGAVTFIAAGSLAQTPPSTDDAAARREARARFELGHAHYDAGRYREAAAEFERAYEVSRRPALLHNVYLAYRDAGDVARALGALDRYLAEDTDIDAASRQTLELRARAMRESVAASGGSGSAATTTASTGAPGSSTTTPPPPSVDAPLPTTDLPLDSSDAAAREEDGGGPPVALGIATLAVGGAAILGSVIAGVVANGIAADRDAVCTVGPSQMECPAGYDQTSAVDDFEAMRGLAWGLGIGGGILAVAGVTLVLLAGPSGAVEEEAVASLDAAVDCRADGCLLELSGHL